MKGDEVWSCIVLCCSCCWTWTSPAEPPRWMCSVTWRPMWRNAPRTPTDLPLASVSSSLLMTWTCHRWVGCWLWLDVLLTHLTLLVLYCWRGDIIWQQGATWTRAAKDRESWRTLEEGYFLQLKDTALNKLEWIFFMLTWWYKEHVIFSSEYLCCFDTHIDVSDAQC